VPRSSGPFYIGAEDVAQTLRKQYVSPLRDSQLTAHGLSTRPMLCTVNSSLDVTMKNGETGFLELVSPKVLTHEAEVADQGPPLQEPNKKNGSVPRVPLRLLEQLPEGTLRRVLEGSPHEASTTMRDELLIRFQAKLVHRPEFKSTTTSTPDKGKAIIGWFFYKEAFASALVQNIVNSAKLCPDALIIDPFGGIGTVPFVCQTLGYRSVSIDMSPLPVFIANTKLQAARRDCSDELLELGKDVLGIIKGTNTKRELPNVSIWAKAFDNDVAHGLFDALELIQRHRNEGTRSADACDITHLALLCVAEEVSHAVKDGTSLRLREPGRRLGRAGITKTVNDLIQRFDRQVHDMARDVRAFHAHLLKKEEINAQPANSSFVGDARQLSQTIQANTVDLVVTSPPYPNRYDYSAIYALELLLGFVRDRDELRSLRFDLFRSHLEAPWPTSVRGVTPAVEEILCALYAAGMSSPRVFKMIIGYFSDIADTLEQLMITMKPGASAHFVVGNVRIEGQEVPVDLILAELAERIGFKLTTITIARHKGTNSQQAKKFGNGRLRESIVEFKKN
jgi:DNA modification methylase